MDRIDEQLAREGRYDVVVALASLALLFAGLIFLPTSAFWFYFVPIAAFWIRYNIVRKRRDEALLTAKIAGDFGRSTAGCYRSEAGICITDGTHHVLIARDDAQATLQLPHIVGSK